ncbi:meiotic recombination protein REC8 homolog isoform X2 [Pseudophryne corroboree]|uniref:meiotic recombination protein REC8 homolog isoform X2 n=1 Tax=Pseudophryne corroboree TaxID=495146 RepID=UPI0030815B25
MSSKHGMSLRSQKIVQYILQQVPPPFHGSPIPRLSLYLSAQLSYGLVCVYHRQCDLLIEEMNSTLERLHKVEKQMKIDLLQSEQNLLIPDSLVLMQMLEHAPDPFFGMMEIPPELPDPMMIPQICVLLETSGPEIVRLEKTPPRHGRVRDRDDTDHLTSPEIITMREVEPVLLQLVEFGQDLPEVSALDLELLVSDIPQLPDVETLPESRKRRERRKDTTQEPKKPKETLTRAEEKKDEERSQEQEENIYQRDARGEVDVEESTIEIESKRRELQEMVRERQRLREEERQTELQQESERERERTERAKREKKRQQEADIERERLKKTVRELKLLQRAGAKEEFLLEKQRQIEHLKALQKEKERQWEAEKLKQQIIEKERESERLQECERDRQRLSEAEQEIVRLKEFLELEKRRKTERLSPEKKEDVDDKRRREGEPLTDRQLPKSGFPSEMVPELDAAALLDEVTGEPIAFFPEGSSEIQYVLHASPQIPSPQLVLAELPQEAADHPAARHSVRRSSLIIDSDKQIGSRIMQEQTKDPYIHTQAAVPVTLQHMKPRTPASLFSSPTYEQFMAPELSALWTRCALQEPLQYIQEREEESMSELEMVRAATESAVSLLLSSEVSLEVSEEERSRAILFTPEERRAVSIQDDRVLPMVSEMPELIVEMPETEEILLSDVQRNLYSQIDSVGHAEFHSLTPRSFSRLLVSRFFFACLALCTKQVIHLEQTEPYGPIVITPGKHYSQD